MSRRASPLLGGIGEAVRMAMRSLNANLFRTVLTLLGIVIGVASVVAHARDRRGRASERRSRSISSIGTNMLTLQPARAQNQRRNLPSTLAFRTPTRSSTTCPTCSMRCPRSRTTKRCAGATPTTRRASQRRPRCCRRRATGRSRAACSSRARTATSYEAVAVLGPTVYDELFTDGQDPLGEWVLIGTMPFQVIGVLTRKGSSPAARTRTTRLRAAQHRRAAAVRREIRAPDHGRRRRHRPHRRDPGGTCAAS